MKPHFLDQRRSTHKLCSPLRENSLRGRPYRTPPSSYIIGDVLRVFARCRSLPKGFQRMPAPPRLFRAGPRTYSNSQTPFSGFSQSPPKPLKTSQSLRTRGLLGLRPFCKVQVFRGPLHNSQNLSLNMAMIGTDSSTLTAAAPPDTASE